MSPETFTLGLLFAGTAAGAAIDVRTRRVPNALTFGLAAAGVFVAAAGLGPLGVGAALAGCATGLGLMLPSYVLGATGAGDVKLFAAAGTLLGPEPTVWAFAFTLMAGGSMALLIALLRGRLLVTWWRAIDLIRTRGANSGDIRAAGENNRFAYAPAVALGALIAAVTV